MGAFITHSLSIPVAANIEGAAEEKPCVDGEMRGVER